jgi:hypothetical protein
MSANLRYFDEYEEKIKTAVRDRRQVARKFLTEYKKGKACIDCKMGYPYYILQFDHVRGTKVANLSDLARVATMEEVIEEVAKCDLVCGNCHAHRSYMRSKK